MVDKTLLAVSGINSLKPMHNTGKKLQLQYFLYACYSDNINWNGNVNANVFVQLLN